MKNQEKVRKLFQTLALILFLIQFQQSIRKYLQRPVVVHTSRVHVRDLPSPVVYICQTDQYNHAKGKTYGYSGFSRFISGIQKISDDFHIISWNNKEGNLTYNDLEKILFEHDYSTVKKIETKSRTSNRFNENHPVQVTFLLPYGVCLKMIDVEPHMWVKIYTTQKMLFLVTDPLRENSVRTIGNAQTTIGPHSSKYFEMKSFELEVKVYDASIHNGKTCKIYTESEMTYGECLLATLKKEVKSVYGCIPPWVPGSNEEHLCTTVANLTKADIKDSIYYDLKEFERNRELDMFKNCLPPCITTKTKLLRTGYVTNRDKKATLDVKSKDWATVHKHAYSYDIFSLTVDLGSSLGLWLGVSCLSILDHVFLKWIIVKKYWMK